MLNNSNPLYNHVMRCAVLLKASKFKHEGIIKLKIFMIIIFISSFKVLGAEIDSYSGTDNFIWSASKFVGHDVNKRLKAASEILNKKNISCVSRDLENSEEFYDVIKDSLKKNISRFFVGHFIAEHFHQIIPENQKIVETIDDSIYSEIGIIDGISLWFKGILGIIKVDGNFHLFGANYIGMDKLGHFFVEGHEFYKRAYLDDDGSIEKAIDWGIDTENGKFGLVTTGVFSHADLVANFNGMRFWNELLAFKKDPISDDTYHNQAYFICENNNWRLNKKFDLDQYTDSMWDERINCNEYRNDEILAKVLARYENVYEDAKGKKFCPAIESRCEDVKEIYKEFSEKLIHPLCLSFE